MLDAYAVLMMMTRHEIGVGIWQCFFWFSDTRLGGGGPDCHALPSHQIYNVVWLFLK